MTRSLGRTLGRTLPVRRLLTTRFIRNYSSSSSSTVAAAGKPVLLASDTYPPSLPSSTSKAPLLILPGLYGSAQNWRSLAKSLAKGLGREVVALDLRNHGLSPHSAEASYLDMAGDVAHWLDVRGLNEGVAVMGHSMGGKVAMALALKPQKGLERLIVVDIAPGVGKISPEFSTYITAMNEVESAAVQSRKEADVILARYEPNLSIRQFLLTNLERPSPTSPYKFRIPLKFLGDALGEIGEFPYSPEESTFNGPTLFIKGAKSKYINRKNQHLLTEFFPASRLEVLDTGHWVHAEKPVEFQSLISAFLK